MTPPPIRYPLPTLILLILLGLLVWKGEELSRPLRAEARRRLDRLVNGPPVPASTTPGKRGALARKGLLLRDGVPVFKSPRGEALAPIDRRGFVAIYDEWSPRGEGFPAEFYRVGTRVPIGWVAAADLLPWDTRLVHYVKGATRSPRPIVGWSKDAVEVVDWDANVPWTTPAGRSTLSNDELRPETVGVLVGQVELPSLLSASIAGNVESASRGRLDAVLGDLAQPPSRAAAEVEAIYAELPDFVRSRRRSSPSASSERIAALNADTSGAEVRWGDRSFRFVALEDLP